MTNQTKKFVRGAMLLSLAGLIAKIISGFYRIPLANLVGDEGLGFYTTVYPLYSILVSASLVGIPNAVSKLISEKVANNKYYDAHLIYRYSMIIISLFGLIVSLFLILGADWIINLGGWHEGTRFVIYGLAISPVFISITGAFKGYFQGMQIMKPTAVTQVIENLVKVVIGIGFTFALLNGGFDVAQAVGGAAVGTSLGFVGSAIYIYIFYLRRRKDIRRTIDKAEDKKTINFSTIAKRIVIVAIPITIGSAAYSIMDLVDSVMVYNRLAVLDINSLYATSMMGQKGMAFSIINVPLTISLALMISIVPSISEAVAKHDQHETQAKIILCIRFALLLALPAAVGLCILSEPIMRLLYSTSSGYEYLALYSVCLVFIILGQALTGILQGMGKYYHPLVSLLVATIIKVILNYYLVASSLQVSGAVIGSIIYYMILVIINYLFVKKYTGIKIDVIIVIKPLIASMIMGIVVLFSFKSLIGILDSNSITTINSIIVGVIVYIVMLILSKALYEDDFAFIPKSDRLVEKMKKINLIN